MGHIMSSRSLGCRVKTYQENGEEDQEEGAEEEEEGEEQDMGEERGGGLDGGPKVGPHPAVIPLSPNTMTPRSLLGLSGITLSCPYTSKYMEVCISA